MVPVIKFFGAQKEGSWGGVDSASYGIKVGGFTATINMWGDMLYVPGGSLI